MEIRTAFHRANRASRFVAGLVATSLGTTILGATSLRDTGLRNTSGSDESSQGGGDKDGELGEHHIGDI